MKRAISVLLLLTAGCTSQVVSTQTHVQSYVGSNISDVQNLYLTPHSQAIGLFDSKTYAWVETQQKFESGNTQHSFSDPYRDCTVIWVADQNGIINSGSYFGKDCLR